MNTPAERDPRTDPRPGDVVSDGRSSAHVVAVLDGLVEWKESPSEPVNRCSLEVWKRAMRESEDLEVIHRAQD